MNYYHVAATVGEGGCLTLGPLPFKPGERVQVTIIAELPAKPDLDKQHPLRGTVLHYDRPTDPMEEDGSFDDPTRYSLRGMYSRYDRPTDPMAEDDWEAAQP